MLHCAIDAPAAGRNTNPVFGAWVAALMRDVEANVRVGFRVLVASNPYLTEIVFPMDAVTTFLVVLALLFLTVLVFLSVLVVLLVVLIVVCLTVVVVVLNAEDFLIVLDIEWNQVAKRV